MRSYGLVEWEEERVRPPRPRDEEGGAFEGSAAERPEMNSSVMMVRRMFWNFKLYDSAEKAQGAWI